MDSMIDSSAKCELCSVIRFLQVNKDGKLTKWFDKDVVLKSGLERQRFHPDKQLQETVETYLNTLAATFYEEGIGKLVRRYNKCFNVHGDYVEK